MRIEVVSRKLPATDAIRQYAEKKSGRLTRHFDRIQLVTWTLDKESPAKELYKVEVSVDVEYHPNFIARAEHNDVYAAIDLATDKAERQLSDFKEKLKLEKR
jgi:putative sigma-54 modulation protein